MYACMYMKTCSWSVVVNSLLPTDYEGLNTQKNTATSDPPQPQRITPAKKLRIRKSKSPQVLGPSSKTAISCDSVPVLDGAALCTRWFETGTSNSSNSSTDGENIVPAMNQMNIATGSTSSGCASLLGMIVATQRPLQSTVRSIKRPSNSSSRTRPGVHDSLLTLTK